mmetsp:Transcript_37725/g.121065  ORF Transcript_37725/g.121065 Transcript_37725/m.121065 type:complete len:174 (+) Transcript_37725:419-940(+)
MARRSRKKRKVDHHVGTPNFKGRRSSQGKKAASFAEKTIDADEGLVVRWDDDDARCLVSLKGPLPKNPAFARITLRYHSKEVPVASEYKDRVYRLRFNAKQVLFDGVKPEDADAACDVILAFANGNKVELTNGLRVVVDDDDHHDKKEKANIRSPANSPAAAAASSSSSSGDE